ncbi:MAG: OsmC family protein [Verrucomicrobiota bacterium]
MVTISVNYDGQLRCQAVHGPSGNQLLTDAPVDNEGKGEAFSPTDLLATGLGTCLLTIIGIVGRKRGLAVEGARAEVKKEMSEDLPRRIVRLPVDIHIPLPGNHPDRALLEERALNCPVFHSLRTDIEKVITFHYEE